MSKIIDCITFYDNNFIFDFRYNVINEFVDKFIICESIFDHRNQKKDKNFDLTGKYKNNPKIIHLLLDKPFPEKTNEWENQAIQRDFILNHLNFVEGEDYIFFSDPDEIPNPDLLKNFKLKKKYGVLLQNFYNYNFNLFNPHETPWEGTRVCKKKKLKAYYGNINERQFRNIYKKASMLRGDTSENLIGLLERRLDAVIYRAKFATTIFSARQLINHGHVKVNSKKVNISSYSVKEEDVIEIRDKSKQLAIIDIALANKERETPEYIQMDEKNKKFKFVRIPKFEEVPYPIVMEPNLVIEYYSR